jgi:chaperonin GroES
MLRPIKNNIIVELIEKEKISAGGIVLQSADREEVSKGLVLAIGPNVEYIKVGELVLPNWNRAQKSKFDDKEFYVISEDEIVLIFDGE